MHRPADSHLLSNLVMHKKDYAKSLKSLQSPSHVLSVYVAACAPPLSNALLQVSAALGGADEALARYVDAVEECREHAARIKELEDDLSGVVRDREILITQLIKASKSVKTSRRDSVHRSSASTHSLSSGMSSPSSTHVHSIHVPTSSKLGAAQAELQACEVTLAQNGRALHHGRVEALRAGLGLQCHALMECSWVWAQVSKTALKALQDNAPPTPKRLPHAAEPFYIPAAHASPTRTRFLRNNTSCHDASRKSQFVGR
ncbi:hypothetical protein C0992_005202 [Termitomyces sp. T32_za158]|nr:hypothetical protein C0992_005202 [Termitomyces sp. T32_za158]